MSKIDTFFHFCFDEKTIDVAKLVKEKCIREIPFAANWLFIFHCSLFKIIHSQKLLTRNEWQK
jgi:hypothetical protein